MNARDHAVYNKLVMIKTGSSLNFDMARIMRPHVYNLSLFLFAEQADLVRVCLAALHRACLK
jgi:hypothetical protein